MKTNEELLQQAKDQVVDEWHNKSGQPLTPKIIDWVLDQNSERITLLAIQSAREEGKPKWIPVEESLPKKGRSVLVCTNENHVTLGYRSGEFWRCEENRTLWVTHWMDRPEPFKKITAPGE